jgi:hypothetical protein
MSEISFSMTQTFESCGPCIKCGVEVILPKELKNRRKENHEGFYCCNGHVQCYLGKTELEKAQELLATERRWREQEKESHARTKAQLEHSDRSRAALKGKVTEIRNRVGNGVCPCCNRSFTNLRRHMHMKHPGFKDALE